MKPLFAIINSGSIGSQALDCAKIKAIRGIHVPAMTSGDIFVQGASDNSSGSFARMIETRSVGSGDLKFATGPGSRFIPWPLGETLPAYLRLEAAVAQTDNRTLMVLTR
jgi:hypothetical protein